MTKLFVLIAVVVLAIFSVYFSDSYTLGREAQEAFDRKDYKLANTLATKALKEDPYNRAAFKIQSQSRQRLNIGNFLTKSKQNYDNANAILKKQKITMQELLELQWIYDDFERDYSTLGFLNSPTKYEKEQIESYAKWFKELEIQVTNAKNNLQK
ncbi:hypothetical protein [Helicobacter sp. WB40]|uniref:hypothetical protein n=1 Tax=Helicobacter sp. WB40 TaxID=3004130 RepID=UPI0022EBED39|nr:hypothetical protein [Helicobacter sp. WB40]MDA3967388.1 hypothetical protein [Helicobacter sp. WB40]